MSNSLMVAGQFELLGQGLAGTGATNPAYPGAVFLLQPGYDLSAPQPTADFVASLLLDGERPQGYRASNRTVTLPLMIVAPTFTVLAAAREALMAAVDQQFWTLTWTRDQGGDPQTYPLVFDCFRALPTTVAWGGPDEMNINPVGAMSLQFQALPYGRSDIQYQLAFASPIPAAPPPPRAPVVLDTFSTINSPQATQSTQCVVGPNSCYWDPGVAPANDPQGLATPLAYGPVVFGSSVDLTGMTSLQMWLGLGSRYFWHHHWDGGRNRVSLYFTFTDTAGNTLAFSRSNLRIPVAETTGIPRFTRVTVPIPQNSATFAYASAASYSLTVVNHPAPALRHVVAYLDALTAYPSSQTTAPATRGNVYMLYGIKGTARAPVSLAFQSGPSAGTVTTYSTAGPGTYTVPANTLYLSVSAIGGGGAGASQTGAGYGGGGGGGESAAETIFPATPGDVIPYFVGAGGTSGATPANGAATAFGPGPSGPLQVTANGGQSAAQNSTTGGSGGTGSPNSVHFPGGTGRTASGSVGGGGGSSGGTAAPGNTPTGTAATVFTSGAGNWTCPPGVTTVLAECWGGGASGGTGSASANGSGGGGGEYAAQQVAVTPGNLYGYVCGAGGGAVSSGGSNGNSGASSTFTADAGVVVTAHGGIFGTGSGSGAGGNGGSGSANGTHFTGGKGGSAYSYTGGGGSSAGPGAVGNAGTSPAGGVAPSGGGSGGAGSGAQNGAGHAGSAPGGGGGGTYSPGTGSSGAGAPGQVRITFPSGLGAPTNTGGTAVSGGGAGGAGGPSANTVGSAGSNPGGGGGGGDSAGSAEAGGAGGIGKLVITPYQSAASKTLIVHRPKYSAHPQYQPMVSVGNGSDVPDGTHFYTMPQPQSGVNASFDGTYSVILIASSFNTPANARTITVTVTQTEYPGGPAYTASTVPVTVSPSVASLTGPGNQVNNGILVAGTVTLPVKALAQDNTAAVFTVSVTDTNTSDRFYDVLLLDTQGQTLIINEPSSGYINYYLDEPTPLYDLGHFLGSQAGRSQAVSVVDAVQAVSGGPFTVTPGECLLFAYSADAGAPSIGVSYYSRYFFDRTD